jgi:hypothetical protein
MSEHHTEVISRRVDGHLWRRCRTLLALLTVGVMGATGALAMSHRANYPPKPPGPGCGWGNLKGDLRTPPTFVLAFDKDFNVQGFFGPGGRVPKSDPTGTPVEAATVDLSRFGTSTVYCYKIDGKRECIEI